MLGEKQIVQKYDAMTARM